MPAPKTTVVVGHRNPDNDAICAAIGYAYLKQQLDPSGRYEACRQGPLPDETLWVLERFGLRSPMPISHIHSRVRDAMTADVISVREDDIMLHAGRIMSDNDVRALVVKDKAGKYKGIVTVRRLAEMYIAGMDMVDTYATSLKLGDIAAACNGTIVLGDPERTVVGHLRVAAAEPETFRGLIEEGDTVVMGDRYRTQRIACEENIGCLLLAVGAKPDPEVVELARKNDVAIICAEQDTYTVTRLVTLARPVSDYLETDALVLDPDSLLSEAIPDILRSHQREAVAVSEDGRCLGIITRSDVAKIPRRRVILVDHNERAQSLPGIDEAEVVEIVDHHRVGDIQTAAPIRFLSLPWGSSSTIVADQFRQNNVRMPGDIAGVLLSAILTDTVLLKSPTTTQVDREIAAWLGQIIGKDPVEFGIELFNRRGSDANIAIETMVNADSKEFEVGDRLMLIAQHETVDMAGAMQRADQIQDYLQKLQANSNYDVVLFLLTDIVNAGSQFFAAGNVRIIERAFAINLSDGSVWMEGVLSRKKQVVTRLVQGT